MSRTWFHGLAVPIHADPPLGILPDLYLNLLESKTVVYPLLVLKNPSKRSTRHNSTTAPVHNY